MYQAYLNAIRNDRELAHVAIVHDQFHIIKRASEAISELLGYLLGCAEAAAADAPSFYRVVRNDNVVYGKRRGDLFERKFEDQTEFKNFVSTLEADLGELQGRRQREFVTRLLDRIDCGEVDDG